MVHADVFYTDPIVGRHVIILEQCNTTRCNVIQYFINTIESVDRTKCDQLQYALSVKPNIIKYLGIPYTHGNGDKYYFCISMA